MGDDQRNKDSGVRGTTPATQTGETLRAAEADGQRCVKCGHYGSVDKSGVCRELGTYPVQGGESRAEYCGCKCTFPIAAPEAEGVKGLPRLINVPERIWLQTGTAVCDAIGDDKVDFNTIASEDLCWCQDKIEEGDVEYISADVALASTMQMQTAFDEKVAELTRVSSDAKLRERIAQLEAKFLSKCREANAIGEAFEKLEQQTDATTQDYVRGLEDAAKVADEAASDANRMLAATNKNLQLTREALIHEAATAHSIGLEIRALISQRTGVVNSGDSNDT